MVASARRPDDGVHGLPAAVRKWGNTGFAEHPVGTGLFVFRSAKRGQELVLDANRGYWRGAAKIDRLVLRPMPDELSRVAALRAGEVNWIEAPSPDNVPPLRDAGYQIMTNGYDHIWPWLFDTSDGPLSDRRVRQALNYAIDREQMSTDLLGGTAEPATQLSARSGIAYDPANDVFGHDPAKARQLLAEAGYLDGFSMTVSYPTGGSGNMQPGPMNEELRSDLAKVGVRVELKPIEWAAMLTAYVSGSFPDGADAVNISLTFLQEVSWSTSFASGSPLNLTRYSNPEVDRLLGESLQGARPGPAVGDLRTHRRTDRPGRALAGGRQRPQPARSGGQRPRVRRTPVVVRRPDHGVGLLNPASRPAPWPASFSRRPRHRTPRTPLLPRSPAMTCTLPPTNRHSTVPPAPCARGTVTSVELTRRCLGRGRGPRRRTRRFPGPVRRPRAGRRRGRRRGTGCG
ncbi:ABC transporter substrate-binding protein [Yinghuangia aomiensis]